MTIGSTAVSLVNRALQEIAARATVTGTNPTFDGSAAGKAAGILYTPAVEMLLREQDWEFSRITATLVTSGVPVLYPWTYSYLYPSDCMKIRSVVPVTWILNDPQPVRWSEQSWPVGGLNVRTILCNVPAAVLVYSTNNVTEVQFDPLFEEALVRFLASELAMALGGRPDYSRVKLEESGSLVQSGAGRDS